MSHKGNLINKESFTSFFSYKAEFLGNPVVGNAADAMAHPIAAYMKAKGATLAVVAGTTLVYQKAGKEVKVESFAGEFLATVASALAGKTSVRASDVVAALSGRTAAAAAPIRRR